MTTTLRTLAIAGLLVAIGRAPAARAEDLIVEVPDLERNPDLVGRDVRIDGRVRFVLRHGAKGFDEMSMQGTSVVFRIPSRLRPDHAPRPQGIRVRGTVRKSGDQIFCDIHEMELLGKDLDRLDRAVDALPGGDFERRAGWARWAERRAKAYRDDELMARALAVEAEAIRVEADRAETDDRPALWLRLAERARARHLPEPEPSALAHRAFRAQIGAARSAEDLERIAGQVGGFFPKAKTPASSPTASRPIGEQDPAAAYRAAPAAERPAMDRRLLADALQLAIDRRAADRPQDVLGLADRARAEIPDRPEVAARLGDRGLDDATRDVQALREEEVMTFAKDYEAQGQPGRARDLKRRWLDDQRGRLSASDAEGRVLLAGKFESMLDDRETAAALAQEALKIDPEYRAASTALTRLGYRQVEGRWVGATSGPAAREAADDRPVNSNSAEGSLRGQTPAEVRAKLGEPDRVSAVAAQGVVVEQWVYRGTTGDQYINFHRIAGKLYPTVHAQFLYRARFRAPAGK